METSSRVLPRVQVLVRRLDSAAVEAAAVDARAAVADRVAAVGQVVDAGRAFVEGLSTPKREPDWTRDHRWLTTRDADPFLGDPCHPRL